VTDYQPTLLFFDGLTALYLRVKTNY